MTSNNHVFWRWHCDTTAKRSVRSMMKHRVSISRPPLVAWLGFGGLLPFVALALLTWVDAERSATWHALLRAYGAVILSFVGALHWGFAMLSDSADASERNRTYLWSVAPSLIAFGALATNDVVGDFFLVGGFLLHYWQDKRFAAISSLPAWYLPLRLKLSAVAIACLASGAIAAAR